MKKALKKLVEESLDRYLPKGSEEPKTLHRAMRYSVFSGGKRIRPLLTLESCLACGGRVALAIPGACAVEIVHTYSLIHDDLPSMDNDDYRRGRLSCHKKFGEAQAILAGDALLTLAFNLISKNCDPETGMRLVKELSEAVGTRGMTGGQAFDIELGLRSRNKKITAKINRLKTAKLFEASVRIGGICAGANKKKISALGAYGAYFGEAFQAIDDLLDGQSAFSRKDTAAIIDKAKSSLKIFCKKSKKLEEIAELVSARTA